MSDIDTLKNRLLELSNRLALKDKMGKDYKKIVSDSLARIKEKITKILTDHNKKVKDITDGSAENLEKTRAELAAQQARLKQENAAALEATRKNQEKLQNNLDDTNKQLNDLQAELNKPNPDIPRMQTIIDELSKDLQSAKDESAAANAQIAQLTERLKAYDGTKEKMDQLVKNLLTKIGDILKQVDAMSINQGDITELLQLLNETEDMFPKEPPGNDGAPPDDNGRGRLFGIGNLNLFGGPAGAGAGAGARERTIYAAPQANSAGSGLPAAPQANSAGSGLPAAPQANSAGSGLPALKIPRGANTAPGQTAPVIIEGGKTRRRRGKKTMRGGYVEKLKAKKTRKRPRTSKRRSGRRRSSSSSSSSNSR